MPVPQSRKIVIQRNAFLVDLLEGVTAIASEEDWHNRNATIWIEFQGFPQLMWQAVIELDPQSKEEV